MKFNVLRFKVFLQSILCHSIVGNFLRIILSNKIPFWGRTIHTSSKSIDNETVALIFWRMYESAEVRFIKKYLNPNLDIIELGSSIGCVSSIIGSLKSKNKKLICVEANTKLLPILEKNLIVNNVSSYYIENLVIDYKSDSEFSEFSYGNKNVLGRLSNEKISNNPNLLVTEIRNEKLTSLVRKYDLKKYALVSDIEGAELQILNSENLDNCDQILIELHDTSSDDKLFTVSDMKDIIINKHGFRLINYYGSVMVFNK